MVYSTSKCPHCKNIVRKQTNPVKEIGNPFEKCPYCGQFYKNSYKEEWISKSPLKRFLFFISNGCLARAFVIPLILVGLCSAGGAVNPGLLAGFYFLGFISWLIAGYFIHKNSNESKIKESLKRTQDKSYLELLKNSGYKIYPIEDYVVKENTENKITLEKYVEEKENKLDLDIDKLIEDSNNGNNEASLTLGYSYLNGENGVEKNIDLAILLFKKAKEQGNIYAKNILKELENMNDNKQ